MQFIIKQVRTEGSFYWDGKSEYTEDMGYAQYYNFRDHAQREIEDMENEDKRNTVIVSVD